MNATERIARALCRLDGHPENIQFEGRPMWQSYLPQVRAVLDAISEPDPAMIDAAVTTASRIGPSDHVGIWRAMVEAMG